MWHNNIQPLVAFRALKAPLDDHPVGEAGTILHKLRMRFRTSMVPFDVEYGVVVLPTMFLREFGDQLGRYATLVDQRHNQFEVLVERNNTTVFFTKGWNALRDFYNLKLDAWVTLVFRGHGRFDIRLRDRFGRKMRCPSFNPPMRFVIERNGGPMNLMNANPVPFVHNEFNFQLIYDKRLIAEEIVAGCLELADFGFTKLALDMRTSELSIVDECGCIWNCTLQFEEGPHPHFIVGGGWSSMAKGRRFKAGYRVILGAPYIWQE